MTVKEFDKNVKLKSGVTVCSEGTIYHALNLHNI